MQSLQHFFATIITAVMGLVGMSSAPLPTPVTTTSIAVVETKAETAVTLKDVATSSITVEVKLNAKKVIATSSKTVEVKSNANVALTNTSVKMEMINGISVPPEPDEKINNSTLAGIDVNKNGVRDDVERRLAEKVENNSDFANALIIARAYQSVVTTKTADQQFIDRYMLTINCNFEKLKKGLTSSDIQALLINTPTRLNEFRSNADRFSGGIFNGSEEECKKLPSGEIDMTYFINQNLRKY